MSLIVLADAGDVAPHVGDGERRDEGRAAFLERLEGVAIGEEGVLHAVDAALGRRDDGAGALRVAHDPPVEPARLAHDRGDLVERQLLDAGHGRRDLGRLARHDLVVVAAVAGEPAGQLDQLGDAVGLVAELPAVAAGDRDRATGGEKARSRDVAGVDRVAERDVAAVRGARAARQWSRRRSAPSRALRAPMNAASAGPARRASRIPSGTSSRASIV